VYAESDDFDPEGITQYAFIGSVSYGEQGNEEDYGT